MVSGAPNPDPAIRLLDLSFSKRFWPVFKVDNFCAKLVHFVSRQTLYSSRTEYRYFLTKLPNSRFQVQKFLISSLFIKEEKRKFPSLKICFQNIYLCLGKINAILPNIPSLSISLAKNSLRAWRWFLFFPPSWLFYQERSFYPMSLLVP